MPTKIEWTEETWNPVVARLKEGGGKLGDGRGWHCTHKSDGCRFCYAEVLNRRLGTGLDYKPGNEALIEISLDEHALAKPLHWKRPRTIFPGSMTDLFADFVTDEMLDEIFAVMALTGRHTYQMLTKRPDRALDYLATCPASLRRRAWAKCREAEMAAIFNAGWPLPNVWIGTSVEDGRVKDRIEVLKRIPAAKRWISFEPLIGHVGSLQLDGIDWAVVGGESGHGYRFEEHFEHAENQIRRACEFYDVAYFLKQMPGKKPIPDHLQLRQMPA